MKKEITRAVQAYQFVRERRAYALTAAHMVDGVAKLNEEKADDDQIREAIHAVDALPIVGGYIHHIRKAPQTRPVPIRSVYGACLDIARQSRRRSAIVAAAKAFMSPTADPSRQTPSVPLLEEANLAYIRSGTKSQLAPR